MIFPIIAITIVLIASVITYQIIQAKRTGYPLGDERTAKAAGMAAQIGILIGSYLILVIGFYNLFIYKMTGWGRLDDALALNVVLVVMNLSYGLLTFFFNRKETL
jgi:hypothetical protein